MTSTSYSHKLPITEFTVDHAYSNESYVFDATAGKINSAFGYIVKGSCTIHSTGKTIEPVSYTHLKVNSVCKLSYKRFT